MKTVGQHLKAARIKQGLTLEQVASKTKIRKNYLDALEADNYAKLPSATYARGFIKNYAQNMQIPPETLLAIFRRDFEEDEAGQIIPRSLVSPANADLHTMWHPRIITGTMIGFVLALFASFLLYQYISLIKPTLKIITPDEGSLIASNLIRISGITDPSATISINEVLVPVASDGTFETDITMNAEKMSLTITATNRRNHQNSVTRTVYKDTSQSTKPAN